MGNCGRSASSEPNPHPRTRPSAGSNASGEKRALSSLKWKRNSCPIITFSSSCRGQGRSVPGAELRSRRPGRGTCQDLKAESGQRGGHTDLQSPEPGARRAPPCSVSQPPARPRTGGQRPCWPRSAGGPGNPGLSCELHQVPGETPRASNEGELLSPASPLALPAVRGPGVAKEVGQGCLGAAPRLGALLCVSRDVCPSTHRSPQAELL